MNITMKNPISILTVIVGFAFLLFAQSCGGSGESNQQSEGAEQQSSTESGLTDFEMEHGIGPITERMEISAEINEEMSARGQEIFGMKCEMCHVMDSRLVGPALGNVMDYRSPEYVMNMILNPGDMARKHPEGQKLVQEYMSVMPYQNVSEEDARALLEYLRDYNMNNN